MSVGRNMRGGMDDSALILGLSVSGLHFSG